MKRLALLVPYYLCHSQPQPKTGAVKISWLLNWWHSFSNMNIGYGMADLFMEGGECQLLHIWIMQVDLMWYLYDWWMDQWPVIMYAVTY